MTSRKIQMRTAVLTGISQEVPPDSKSRSSRWPISGHKPKELHSLHRDLDSQGCCCPIQNSEEKGSTRMANNRRAAMKMRCLHTQWNITQLSQKINPGAGEMAQRLRALTAPPKVLSSIPSNHMVAHNYLQSHLTPSSGVSGDSVLTYMK